VVSADPGQTEMKYGTVASELLVHYKEGPDGLDEEVASVLQTSFGTILSHLPDGETPLTLERPEEIADRLARIIFSFSRAAAAGEPDTKAIAGIRTALFEFVQERIPIEVQMLWSPKKHWRRGAESAVDLAELAAFQTLISIDAAVRAVYRAGMSFVIDLEDIEFQFMEGESEEVVSSQEIYISGMKRLLNALGLDELFILRRISEHARDAEELGRWRQQMAENYRALEAYWHESEGCPVSSLETLASFRELRRLGWKGTIPSEMRSYYLNLLGRRTDVSDAEKLDMVLRNLATILLHYQAGLLSGSGRIRPLKFSFVRSAAAAPTELQHGRVNIRFAPRRLCSRVSAAGPWATKGFVCGRGNNVRVSFRGWRELAGGQCRFAEGWVSIAGRNGAARVRADFMRED
jgi:hypothetical protein